MSIIFITTALIPYHRRHRFDYPDYHCDHHRDIVVVIIFVIIIVIIIIVIIMVYMQILGES